MEHTLAESRPGLPDFCFAELLGRMAPARFAAAVAMIVLGATIAARAQSALDGFDPNANGLVRVVVVQPDGKILLGGDFTTLAPNGAAAVPRNRIARLNPDGTLDAAFNPNASSSIYAIALQTNGKILVGGVFATLAPNGGAAVTRNRIARLNEDGTLDANFDPNANNAVLSIAVQTDGRILVGGSFTSIGGLTRNRIARLDSTTGVADLQFDPNAADNAVSAIVARPDGKVLVGGSFTGIGGQARLFIARLNPDATLDTAFHPNANGDVLAIAIQADGSIVAGGKFTTIGGQTRNRIARLNPTTGLADSFNPNANSDVRSLAIQPDGKIVAGGFFFTIGGQSRPYLARLNPNGTADAFNPTGSSPVHAVAVQSDGSILAGGQFLTMGGASRNRIARLQSDGRLDQTLNLNLGKVIDVLEYPPNVSAIAVQPDGKVIIGGLFSSILGVARKHLARLNTDGTLDTAFNPDPSGPVGCLAIQADGKILVTGSFSTIGGQARNHFARLDATTGLADSFNPNVEYGYIYCIAVQADGKILVGGTFSKIGAEFRRYMARLDSTTGLADSFNPNPNNPPYSIEEQTDGKILVGGEFWIIGGQARKRIARLDPATGLADSFDPNADGRVDSIAVQTDGLFLVGGQFENIGGQARRRLARLDAATGLADSFDPKPNGSVKSITVQADGNILVGGFFTSIAGQVRNRIARLDPTTGAADSFNPNADYVGTIVLQRDGKILVGGGLISSIGGELRDGFARLSNDTSARQNFIGTPTTVTWIGSGSSPHYTRVVFEISPDNINYTFLGNGSLSLGAWTLTGLNLPMGQNLYIRARGFFSDGASSIQEYVQNVFLTEAVASSARIDSIERLAGGVFDLRGVGTPNATYPLQASPDLTPLSFMPIGNVTTNGQGDWQFLDLDAAGQPRRFYRLTFP